MRVGRIVLRRLDVPLVTAFRTSYGTETGRDALLIEVEGPAGSGWGECVAMAEPLYSPEYVDGAHAVIRDHLLPRLAAAGPDLPAEDVVSVLRPVKGHPMAKASLEMAILDGDLREQGRSLSGYLVADRVRVPAGVAVGIEDSLDALVDVVARRVEEGYVRVKLKICPGWDIEAVAAVRKTFPELALQVDANSAYTLSDADHLARLDRYGLLLIEQPLAEDDLAGHAALASLISTPICLDESITSAAVAADAVDRGACSVVNIKAGRLGGYLEAKRVHDLCVERGVPVWCGGMLETGLGRAANAALAALPGFTLPGDLSASERYFRRDVTEPFVLEDGHIRVPDGPGIGVEPIPEILDQMTVSMEEFPFPAA